MKVIFLDIDGTLVDYTGKLPESAVIAIKEARKNGHRVYLTTGRSRAEIYPHLWEIGLDGLIGGNGMYIEDNGKVLQDKKMDKEDVRKAVDWMNEREIGFYLESKNGLFGNEYFMQTAPSIYGENSKENEEKIRTIFPHMIFNGELYRDDVAKISFCLIPDYLDEAKRVFGEELKVGSWSLKGQKQEFGEFAIVGIDKVNAVHTLIKYLGADMEDTFAFGDAESDAQMVQNCKVGVAMGNAASALKEVADYVTADVEKDGLYQAFKHYGLI